MFRYEARHRNAIRGLCVLTGLLLATDVFALSGSWETKAPKPTAVSGARAGVVNGMLHVVGGSTSSSDFSTIHEVYDPGTNTWSSRAPIPVQRVGAVTEGIGGKLYVVGGDIGSNTGTAALVIYDPVTDSWSSGAPMPAARNSMASGVINGVLYVAGGDIAGVGVPTSNLYAYDPATNTWTTKAPMPLPRRGAAGAVIGGKLYVVGGLEACCSSRAELQIYDSLTNTWSLGAPLPQGRNVPVAGVINGKLYAVTGINAAGNGVANEAWEYDPATNSWTQVASIPTARVGATGGVIGGKLYVVAGSNLSGFVGALEAFTPGAPSATPFASFNAKVEIALGPLANDDAFEVKATFTLGAGSNGSYPLTEDVSLQVGTFSTTIPAGSFEFRPAKPAIKKGKGGKPEQFKFEGVINGVALEAKITPVGTTTFAGATSFEFKAEGERANLTGTANPVTVKLKIGDDEGSTTVTANDD